MKIVKNDIRVSGFAAGVDGFAVRIYACIGGPFRGFMDCSS